MHYDLAPFENRVELGYLRKSETDDLVLYGYTDRCTFDRAWDEYTLIARGLILEKSTGNVVAKCFPKFFNLGEREETSLDNLPAELGYTVQEKVDGSLGIIFNYKGKWTVATRGSFFSEQAQKAQELLKKYDLANLREQDTLLVEIIYPENRIVVNYGNDEKLVLLAMYDRENGEEFSSSLTLSFVGDLTGMPVAKTYSHTINQMIKLQKSLPKDEEGFVVRFNNGLRVKIKGEEYSKISRILSNMSPISFWEAMANGRVLSQYLEQLPEEFRKEYEPMVEELERQYVEVLGEIQEEIKKVPGIESDGSGRYDPKTVGMFIHSGKHGLKHPAAVFPFIQNKSEMLDKYAMKSIRPTGNVIRNRE